MPSSSIVCQDRRQTNELSEEHEEVAPGNSNQENGLKISLVSLHGLIRATDAELGRAADTGGQVKYVIDLAKELAAQPNVSEVELLTHQIFNQKVGPDYAQMEEEIAANAKIVRIPFDPKRYLAKERLWPHIEMFVDQTLVHFRRTGIPDVIHGHYADAGITGAQLARLLHVPFIFTGHSLERVKKERLSLGRTEPERLEKKYNFTTRTEDEEFSLETASMVVTSTNKEVEDQYARYEHYEPSQMEVIPPGVDLTEFSAVTESSTSSAIAAEIDRFLVDENKPLILTMARPDEQKLVEVYGQSSKIQERANLVMIVEGGEMTFVICP